MGTLPAENITKNYVLRSTNRGRSDVKKKNAPGRAKFHSFRAKRNGNINVAIQSE
jgi:hypothetical protein